MSQVLQVRNTLQLLIAAFLMVLILHSPAHCCAPPEGGSVLCGQIFQSAAWAVGDPKDDPKRLSCKLTDDDRIAIKELLSAGFDIIDNRNANELFSPSFGEYLVVKENWLGLGKYWWYRTGTALLSSMFFWFFPYLVLGLFTIKIALRAKRRWLALLFSLLFLLALAALAISFLGQTAC